MTSKINRESKTQSFKIPKWAIMPVEFGDYGGLKKSQKESVTKFLSSIRSNGLFMESIVYGDEYFSEYNDVVPGKNTGRVVDITVKFRRLS